MTDDFTALTNADHYLDWLGGDSALAVRGEIERMLRKQVPTAKLEWIRLLGEPYFLTGGRKLFNDDGKMILTRAALAVSFELEVSSSDGAERLRGVFSWTATGLDKERDDNTYLDLNVEMNWAKAMLAGRIYNEPEAITETPAAKRSWWKFWEKQP